MRMRSTHVSPYDAVPYVLEWDTVGIKGGGKWQRSALQ